MEQGVRTRRGRRWFVGLATTASLLLLAEIGLRVYLFGFASEEKRVKYARPGDLPLERAKYVPHPYLSYALNPLYRSQDGQNRHDALGFRGEEISPVKAPGTYRIVCVGGSTVYDTEIEDHRAAFPAQLEACLRERGHPEVEVVNGGVGGYTSFETLIDLALRVLEVGPDLLVIYHNTNDVHARLVPPDAFRCDNTGYRHEWWTSDPWWDRSLILRWLGVQWGFSPRNTLEYHSKVLHDEARDPSDSLARNGTRYFARNTEEMIVLARQRGAAVMLSTFARCPACGGYAAEQEYRRGFEENDAAMRALAARMDAPFYDFAAEMPLDLEFWADGVHNTAAGARKKAELFASFIAAHFLSAARDG
jgi:lysophospholipase L1-like esterase